MNSDKDRCKLNAKKSKDDTRDWCYDDKDDAEDKPKDENDSNCFKSLLKMLFK